MPRRRRRGHATPAVQAPSLAPRWRDDNGHALDCGHFIAEERPTELLEALRPFLRRAGSAS
jgi:pimeloyl-ACP methyl ester carboxylesterase